MRAGAELVTRKQFCRDLIGAAGFVLLLPEVAWAGSLAAFERDFASMEQFFQPMDAPAPAFDLHDADGHAVSLADFRGKVVVLNFIYTSCPDICPLESERVAALQRMINPTDLRDRVRFVSVTADPVRDTPDVIKAYGVAHGLDPATWFFLTSGADHPDATRVLSQRYHSQWREEPDGSLTHAAVFHVIDGEGRWRANFHGLDWKPEHLITFIRALATGDYSVETGWSSWVWHKIKTLF